MFPLRTSELVAQRLTVRHQTKVSVSSEHWSGRAGIAGQPDMFSIIIRASLEDEDIQISSDIYETFQSNISSVLDGEQR